MSQPRLPLDHNSRNSSGSGAASPLDGSHLPTSYAGASHSRVETSRYGIPGPAWSHSAPEQPPSARQTDGSGVDTVKHGLVPTSVTLALKSPYSRRYGPHPLRDTSWSQQELDQPKDPSTTASSHRLGGATPNPTVYPDIDSLVAVVEFISSQYERAYYMMAVKQVLHQRDFVQSIVLAGIRLSKTSCLSLFLGAKIFQAMESRHTQNLVKPYLETLHRFSQHLASTNPAEVASRELLGLLSASLEIYETGILADHCLAAKLLRQAMPFFVQVAYTNNTLQAEYGRFSLFDVLTSPHPDMIRFATGDVVMAMMFGLPHLVNWDVTLYPNFVQRERVEWWPGCPAEFILAISKVSIWRLQDPSVRHADEWRQVEHNVKNWRPIWNQDHPTTSWDTIARLAKQETLRHAILIYVYMGMCGVPSGDPRVQHSCTQIVQMLSLTDDNPGGEIHFFFPTLIAGICAIREQHRSIIYNVLNLVRDCGVFLYHRYEFPRVMDHLWHGAGANGAQVTWNDYLRSCWDVIELAN